VGPAESQPLWNAVAGDRARNGSAHTGQPDNEGRDVMCDIDKLAFCSSSLPGMLGLEAWSRS